MADKKKTPSPKKKSGIVGAIDKGDPIFKQFAALDPKVRLKILGLLPEQEPDKR